MNENPLLAAVQKSRHLSGLLRGRALAGTASPVPRSVTVPAVETTWPVRTGGQGSAIWGYYKMIL
jgi:hypothetical protein